MADVKVSALTALTGADLANGDQFLVTDVGSPNVSKSITADELAQGSQFSSRYAPKAGDSVFVPVGALTSLLGSPTEAATGLFSFGAGWLLDSASSEGVGLSIVFPDFWQTFDIDLLWINAGAGSGNVAIQLFWGNPTSGSDWPNFTGGTAVLTKTALAQNKVDVWTAASNVSATGDLFTFLMTRVGADAGDTLGNDIALAGINFRRAS
jgi:hypothetical protein